MTIPSPSLESNRMTMSLPLWLLVSSEYPSSNLLELIEEAGRKAWRYGGAENCAVLPLRVPAMALEDAAGCIFVGTESWSASKIVYGSVSTLGTVQVVMEPAWAGQGGGLCAAWS